MRIYYTAANNGDGSASVHFYESQECVDKLEELDPEGYGMGEGGGWFEIPDGTAITHEKINTMADVDEYLVEMGFIKE